MAMKNYYEVLNVSSGATSEDIKKAYRVLVKQYHPDRNQGDPNTEEKMAEINRAYDTLSDPQQKLLYDQSILAEQMRIIREENERKKKEAQTFQNQRRHVAQRDPAGLFFGLLFGTAALFVVASALSDEE